MPDPTPPNARPLRIFTDENHVDTAKYLRMYFEQMGHSVSSARTFGDALSAIPASSSDVLICDIGLPDGSGWDLLARLDEQRPAYPIAISGFGTHADICKSK